MNKDGLLFHRVLRLVFTVGLAHALSAQVRGAGTVTNATEANLRAALAGGGLVTIACEGTITLGSTLDITNATTIDGTGHSLTISGGNAVRVFLVYQVPFTMTNVTVAKGYDFGGGGGMHSAGTPTTLVDCTFAGNSTADTGGAIFGYGGLIAIGCTFITNSGPSGGAVALPGSAISYPTHAFTNCTFYGQTGTAITRAHYGGSVGGQRVQVVKEYRWSTARLPPTPVPHSRIQMMSDSSSTTPSPAAMARRTSTTPRSSTADITSAPTPAEISRTSSACKTSTRDSDRCLTMADRR